MGRRESRHTYAELPLAFNTHSVLVRPEIGNDRVAASGYHQSKKYSRGQHQHFSHHQSIRTFHQSLQSTQ
jgi:hypothetical protein